jgi:hypothetical protein
MRKYTIKRGYKGYRMPSPVTRVRGRGTKSFSQGGGRSSWPVAENKTFQDLAHRPFGNRASRFDLDPPRSLLKLASTSDGSIRPTVEEIQAPLYLVRCDILQFCPSYDWRGTDISEVVPHRCTFPLRRGLSDALMGSLLLPHMCVRLSPMWQMLHRRMVVRKLVLHHPLSSLWAAARPKGHICICIPLIIERKLVCRASYPIRTATFRDLGMTVVSLNTFAIRNGCICG